MNRFSFPTLLLIGVALTSGCTDPSTAESTPRISVDQEQQRFDALLAKSPDLTYRQLADHTPQRDFLKRLSYDPTKLKFYDETAKQLQLTDNERQTLQEHGFVSVDHGQRYSFGSLYFAVYSSDLPVLVTTDSILHALHRTYDDLLMEMEQTFFTAALDEVLTACYNRIPSSPPSWGATARNYEDVDLYLTVARNLLQGAGAPAVENARRGMDAWDGAVLVSSKLGQDEAVIEILKLVQSLTLQSPQSDEVTQIYGGERAIDYSQFKPRGHYTKSVPLSRYFRAMMWLGRADTGWNVLPPDPQAGIVSDVPRELRNAVLLTQLLTATGSVDRVRQMSDILDFMVGEGDSLTPLQTTALLERQKIASLDDLTASGPVESFQQSLRKGEFGTQQIRSQVVLSDPNDRHQVSAPSTFQMFGQRFVVDSFVLSKVVFDSIIYQDKKVQRHMPTGLDVMFALGNDTVLPLLEAEMSEFPYAANLQASQEYIAGLQPDFWQTNLYNVWLDAIRTLDADLSTEKHLPEAMRTDAWQRKQLQTQLASWAELRHNTVLYVKQSYGAEASCEYPTGYVEPYPELYARIRFFAEEAARRIDAANYSAASRDFTAVKSRQVDFLKQMAVTLDRLESLARKELTAEPFTPEDQEWLKKVIDIRGGGSGRPQYTGWYCQLFYLGGHRSAEWDPTIVDAHTDPNSQTVLEEGVGNCNFLVVAIDNEEDRMIYVGPTYSYYEFLQPVENRLDDQAWQQLLQAGTEPPRPPWINDFQGPRLIRHVGR